MSEIRCGDLMVQTRDGKVMFAVAQQAKNCAILDLSELPILVEFLENHLANQANKRSSFRIELSRLDASVAERFQVFVTTVKGLQPLKAIDISLTGIYGESPHSLGEVGEEVNITLNYDEVQIVLPATIVRQKEKFTAFYFHTVVRNRQIVAPKQLVRIFRALESNWLTKNLQLDWAQPETDGKRSSPV